MQVIKQLILKKRINKDIISTLIILVLSVIMMAYYTKQNMIVSFYDENRYIAISKMILQNGIFNLDEPLRTYFYPFLIALFSLFSNGNIIVVKVLMTVFQYAVFVFTVFYIKDTINGYMNNKAISYFILCAGLLNPYLIQACSLFLTDILSSCFITVALFMFMKNKLVRTKSILIYVLLIYVSVMIRPSMLLFLPIMLLYVFSHYRKNIKHLIKFLIISTLGLVVFIPQLYNNIHYYNHWTPLIHESLYSAQSAAAARILKYGSVVIGGQAPQLPFYSPFTVAENADFYSLILTNFHVFVFLIIAHIFAAIDWGYIDTYIRDFYPVSRLIASFFLYIFWIFVATGLFCYFRSISTNKYLTNLLITSLFYIAFVSTTQVESRFGYPLYFLLLPFACLGYNSFLAMKNKRKIMQIIIFFIIICLFYIGSIMLDMQTNRIDWIRNF